MKIFDLAGEHVAETIDTLNPTNVYITMFRGLKNMKNNYNFDMCTFYNTNRVSKSGTHQ